MEAIPVFFNFLRLVWVLHVIALAFFLAKTNLLKNWMSTGVNPNHVVFFSAFFIVTCLSLSRKYFNKIVTIVTRNFKYVVLGIVIAGVIFEVSLRYTVPSKYPVYSSFYNFIVNGKSSIGERMYQSDDYFSYKAKKNLNQTIKSLLFSYTAKVKTNSEGFRFFIDGNSKPNVMFLGDSVTFGIGASNGETYPEFLDELFEKNTTC